MNKTKLSYHWEYILYTNEICNFPFLFLLQAENTLKRNVSLIPSICFNHLGICSLFRNNNYKGLIYANTY